jgi:NAD(P)H-dependent flavin oxidoreductase YrpB (nitropropane dioxygenase family)
MRSLLPDCCQECDLLAQIQMTLAGGISSGHSISPAEDYCLAVNER